MTKSWDKRASRPVPLADLIGNALALKVLAGKGSRYRKGKRKQTVSKREKTRQFWAEHPEVKPWPLRPRLANKTEFKRREK